jgi:hypothetical protein
VNSTCVQDYKVGTDSATKIEEHDGRVLTDPTISGVSYAEIAPISIAQFISQTNHVLTGVTDRRGTAKLGTLEGQAPIVNGAIDSTFPTTFTRPVFHVVPTSKVSGFFADPALVEMFVGNASDVCTQASVIQLYGFSTNASCGDTSLKGKD